MRQSVSHGLNFSADDDDDDDGGKACVVRLTFEIVVKRKEIK